MLKTVMSFLFTAFIIAALYVIPTANADISTDGAYEYNAVQCTPSSSQNTDLWNSVNSGPGNATKVISGSIGKEGLDNCADNSGGFVVAGIGGLVLNCDYKGSTVGRPGFGVSGYGQPAGFSNQKYSGGGFPGQYKWHDEDLVGYNNLKESGPDNSIPGYSIYYHYPQWSQFESSNPYYSHAGAVPQAPPPGQPAQRRNLHLRSWPDSGYGGSGRTANMVWSGEPATPTQNSAPAPDDPNWYGFYKFRWCRSFDAVASNGNATRNIKTYKLANGTNFSGLTTKMGFRLNAAGPNTYTDWWTYAKAISRSNQASQGLTGCTTTGGYSSANDQGQINGTEAQYDCVSRDLNDHVYDENNLLSSGSKSDQPLKQIGKIELVMSCHPRQAPLNPTNTNCLSSSYAFGRVGSGTSPGGARNQDNENAFRLNYSARANIRKWVITAEDYTSPSLAVTSPRTPDAGSTTNRLITTNSAASENPNLVFSMPGNKLACDNCWLRNGDTTNGQTLDYNSNDDNTGVQAMALFKNTSPTVASGAERNFRAGSPDRIGVWTQPNCSDQSYNRVGNDGSDSIGPNKVGLKDSYLKAGTGAIDPTPPCALASPVQASPLVNVNAYGTSPTQRWHTAVAYDAAARPNTAINQRYSPGGIKQATTRCATNNNAQSKCIQATPVRVDALAPPSTTATAAGCGIEAPVGDPGANNGPNPAGGRFYLRGALTVTGKFCDPDSGIISSKLEYSINGGPWQLLTNGPDCTNKFTKDPNVFLAQKCTFDTTTAADNDTIAIRAWGQDLAANTTISNGNIGLCTVAVPCIIDNNPPRINNNETKHFPLPDMVKPFPTAANPAPTNNISGVNTTGDGAWPRPYVDRNGKGFKYEDTDSSGNLTIRNVASPTDEAGFYWTNRLLVRADYVFEDDAAGGGVGLTPVYDSSSYTRGSGTTSDCAPFVDTTGTGATYPGATTTSLDGYGTSDLKGTSAGTQLRGHVYFEMKRVDCMQGNHEFSISVHDQAFPDRKATVTFNWSFDSVFPRSPTALTHYTPPSYSPANQKIDPSQDPNSFFQRGEYYYNWINASNISAGPDTGPNSPLGVTRYRVSSEGDRFDVVANGAFTPSCTNVGQEACPNPPNWRLDPNSIPNKTGQFNLRVWNRDEAGNESEQNSANETLTFQGVCYFG